MRTLLIGLMAIALAGCSGAEPSSTSAPPASVAEPELVMLDGVNMGSFALPLDAYGVTAADGRAEVAAFRQVYEQCMGQFGFIVADDPAPVLGWGSQNERRYGIQDVDAAGVWGYHVPDESRPALQQPIERLPLPADEEAVAYGIGPLERDGKAVPFAGCWGEASRSVGRQYGPIDSSSPLMLSTRLSTEALSQTRADSRVHEAFRAWSDCMWRAGFDYPDPASVVEGPWIGSDLPPSAREIAVAVADTTCKAAVDLIDVLASVESAYQHRALEQNAEALAVAKQEADRKRQRVAEILTGVQ